MTLPIARVVVHPDGAMVTREGRLPIELGEVRIRELPLLLDPTSVRVALGGVSIRQVRVELDLADDDRGPRPEVVDDWRRSRDELTALDVSLEAVRYERDVLARLAPRLELAPERDVPAVERWQAWRAADRTVDERVAHLDEELRTLGRTRRDLVERIGILAQRVEAASSQSWWRRWEPTRRVRVEVGGTGEAEVALSYRVLGARWSPAYTLDADAALRGGRFAMRATVVQGTGEDWSQVALALTSAPSERRLDVPELAALRLGSRAPSAPSGWRELPADLDALFPEPPTARFRREPSPPPPPEQRMDDEVLELSLEVSGDDEPTAAVELMTLSAPYPQSESAKSAPRRAAGLLGGLARAVADNRPMAPAGAAVSTRSRQKGGGGAPRDEAAAVVAPTEVAEDWLDYGRLRLQSGDAGPGRRGRLAAVTEAELLADQAPIEACTRYTETLGRRREDARRVAGAPMPPHHVLPGPIGGSDVRIDAVGRVDVPSDGLPHTVAVTTWPVELEVAYRAVPRHDPRAFRQVTATVPYERPLLPGPVEVYVDGRLELTSPWAGSGGRGKLKIGLGAEDRLKLVRNVRYREESAGLFGGSRRMHTTVEVRIASALPRSVQVELLERVPVPLKDSELTVELVESQPPAQPYAGEPDGPILEGGKRQRLDVAPGAEVRATLSYAVTIGGKDEIVGGDRRG